MQIASNEAAYAASTEKMVKPEKEACDYHEAPSYVLTCDETRETDIRPQ